MRDFWEYLTLTYNVWFTAPLAIAFLFAIFRLIVGSSDFGNADIDAEANVDTALDLDMDADIAQDVETDLDVDADMGVNTDGDGNALGNVFGFLNVGKIPFMIMMMALFITWGFSGLIANELLNITIATSILFGVSCSIALISSIFGTRYLSLKLAKIFPESDPATKDRRLLGMQGRVISGQITTTFGTARVEVPDGHALTVRCRVKPDAPNPVKGDIVVLVSYDSEQRIFDVTPIAIESH